MKIPTPTKPFPSYAWHWTSFQPTENLNLPPVFYGVLRALRKCEGQQKSSIRLQKELATVEHELQGRGSLPARLNLARDRRRNLLRNSGQYWQALGLLEATSGAVQLTDLGRKVADREITQADFVVATIRSLALPNPLVTEEPKRQPWVVADLEIRPLRLILEIVASLYDRAPEKGYLEARELFEITIPLAGAKATVEMHVEAIEAFRAKKLDITSWPDCTPEANDRRSATEFLLFLSFNELLVFERSRSRVDWRFRLSAESVELVTAILQRAPSEESLRVAVAAAAQDQVSELVVRARRTVEQIVRPGQQSFRREVLRKHGARCILTGETVVSVLVAAHILHARWGGPESWENGVPLRADVHILWDQGLIDIQPDGEVRRHTSLNESPTYADLPASIKIPAGVSANLQWRLKYQ